MGPKRARNVIKRIGVGAAFKPLPILILLNNDFKPEIFPIEIVPKGSEFPGPGSKEHTFV